MPVFLLLLCIPTLYAAQHDHSRRMPPSPLWRRSDVPPEGYFSPLDKGGSLLTQVPGTFPAGLGEPLNAIIVGSSDSDVLKDSETDGGLRNYFLSFGYSSECLGQHLGDDQGANLGDGHGYKNETAVIRWNYGDPQLGSCKETIEGGSHFRYWVQDGKDADSGAIFIAASYELPIAQHHDIVPNGYNLGRDWMIGNATGQSELIPTLDLTNTSTYSGQTTFNNYTYQTDVTYVAGLLANSSDGVNHYLSVAVDGRPAVDGLVAVMQVKIISRPASSAIRILSSQSLPLLYALVAFSSLVSLSL
ncbi:hypothetical protein QCA50_006771 [Cerrena zonata]|uniref:Uncharacterized protein n=1 Tax=Cerrena zonata TaxID=2478898 RepID=A0AAW0GEV8_9APHY